MSVMELARHLVGSMQLIGRIQRDVDDIVGRVLVVGGGEHSRPGPGGIDPRPDPSETLAPESRNQADILDREKQQLIALISTLERDLATQIGLALEDLGPDLRC